MNLKLGYALSAADLFSKFNINKISTHFSILKKFYKTREKKEMAVKIFIYGIYLIILDIIENNVTFVLPTVKRGQIQMGQMSGSNFTKAWKNGKFNDIDFIKTNNTGYFLEFRFQKNGWFKKKHIYLNSSLKKKIAENANNGMKYL